MAKYCSRCLLNTGIPGVVVREGDQCSVCEDYDRQTDDLMANKEKKMAELEGIFEIIRKRKLLYDVVVPLSGGRDSTYVLYLCKKKYNLNCLAVTWENGFLAPHAKENIERACRILNVDHLYYGLGEEKIMRLYSYFFARTGLFCPVCMSGISAATARAQAAFNIPLAVTGTSKRTEEHTSPEYFMWDDRGFMKNVFESETIREDAEVLMDEKCLGFRVGTPGYRYFWERTVYRRKVYSYLNLPDYMEWKYGDVYRSITDELDWSAHKKEAEHTDCVVDNVVHYFRYRKYPALIPELLRYSKLVTAGQMSRTEAEKKVEEIKSSMKEPANLDWFLETLQLSRKEMDHILSIPDRHMKYIQHPSQMRKAMRKVKARAVRIVGRRRS
jgi:hypothetical protein